MPVISDTLGVGSQRLHVVIHLREHKKTQILWVNAPRLIHLLDFTQAPIFKEPNHHDKNTWKRLEDLKHKKTGRLQANTTKWCTWLINAHSSHSQPSLIQCSLKHRFQLIRNSAWKHTGNLSFPFLGSKLRLPVVPPTELCCTQTVVFDWRNGCNNLMTIGQWWGSVADGLGLQLLLRLLLLWCERNAQRSEGASPAS